MQDEALRQESITYVGWGIANIINGRLYMHKKLKEPEYKDLKRKILEHEKGHNKCDRYTIWDMIHDTKHTRIDLDLVYFIFSTPSALIQFSPIIYHNRQIILDRQTIYLYSMIMFAGILGWIIL